MSQGNARSKKLSGKRGYQLKTKTSIEEYEQLTGLEHKKIQGYLGAQFKQGGEVGNYNLREKESVQSKIEKRKEGKDS